MLESLQALSFPTPDYSILLQTKTNKSLLPEQFITENLRILQFPMT